MIVKEMPSGCLNPCFSGRWSRRVSYNSITWADESLNPCFSGRGLGDPL